MDKELFTVDEVAHIYGLSRTKVFDLLRTGHIESVKIGASRRITAQAIKDFVQSLHEVA